MSWLSFVTEELLWFITHASLFFFEGEGGGEGVGRGGAEGDYWGELVKDVLLGKKRLCKYHVTENVICIWFAEAKNFAIKEKVTTKVRKVWTKATPHMSRTCKTSPVSSTLTCLNLYESLYYRKRTDNDVFCLNNFLYLFRLDLSLALFYHWWTRMSEFALHVFHALFQINHFFVSVLQSW